MKLFYEVCVYTHLIKSHTHVNMFIHTQEQLHHQIHTNNYSQVCPYLDGFLFPVGEEHRRDKYYKLQQKREIEVS